MQTITTIGLDIAKSVFQVHGVDAAGAVVIRRQLKRRSVLAFFQKLPPCLVGIEWNPYVRARYTCSSPRRTPHGENRFCRGGSGADGRLPGLNGATAAGSRAGSASATKRRARRSKPKRLLRPIFDRTWHLWDMPTNNEIVRLSE
jgi:hypothetical protein